MPQQDRVYLCPDCGSAAVDYSVISNAASCRKCSWKGSGNEAMEHKFQHSHGSQEEVTFAFMQEFKTVFAKDCAATVGRLLMKWGFISSDRPLQNQLIRYITVAAQAMAKAIIAEREKMEKES